MVRKNQRLVFLVGAILLTGMVTSRAETWYVATGGDDVNHIGKGGWDQAYATISRAVSSSAAGDRILVSNGTYVLSSSTINVGDRRISGFSGNPADTIISGDGRMRCFLLDHENSFVERVTITNGLAVTAVVGGGGAHISEGGTVSNCWIVGNIGASDNAPYMYGGGGVLISGTGGSVLNCLIAGNISSNDGAGIMVRGAKGPVLVRNCVISNNVAARHGGGAGLYITTGVTVERCDILKNTASNSGGGLWCIAAGDVVENCRILDNTALSIGGGGMHISSSALKVRNCLIAGNTVTEGEAMHHGGGGVNIFNNGHLVNCTIVSNTANANAGGIVYYSAASSDVASISNTIVCFNTVTTGVNPNWVAGSATQRGSLSFYNCCLVPINNLPGSSTGNIDADPLFVDNAGDYRLQASSPCINAGINQDWMIGARDVDGRPRLDWFTGQVDMGCYEHVYQGTILQVR